MTPQIRLIFGRKGRQAGTFLVSQGETLIADGTDVYVHYPAQSIETETPGILISRKDCAKLRGLLDARRSLLAYEFNFGYRDSEDSGREEIGWIEEIIARLDNWRESD